jgi:hypothetical protein
MGVNGNRAAMLTGMALPFPAGFLAAVLKTGPPGPLNWCPIPHNDETAGFWRSTTLIAAIS